MSAEAFEAAGGSEIRFRHARSGRRREIDTRDLRAALGGALSSPDGPALCREVARRGEAGLAEPRGRGAGGRP